MKAFGSFRLDTIDQCLWREGARIALTPKVFAVLRYLVDHPGRLVTQEELLEAIWPETYVQPEILRKYILELRKVLSDDPKSPRFIETLPKRGYRFLAATEEAPLMPASVGAPGPVGRDQDLAALDGHFRKALEGRRRLVLVTGEAGVGKSTLLDAFEQRLAGHSGMRIARGQCVEGFGGKEAYYPILDAFGQLIRGPGAEGIIQILASQAPTWLIQFPSLLKADQREALQREILGATRERMVREICEALELLTATDPLALVLEDLHWADPSTLDLISALARRRGPCKLLLLGTYRPVDVILLQSPLKALRQDLVLHKLCFEIALERLTEPDVAGYLAAEFPGELPAGLAELVYRHSEGNPLFMTAIVSDLLKSGLLVKEEAAWRLTAPLTQIVPGVPETLQQMLEIQVERFSETEQRVLKAPALWGADSRPGPWPQCSTRASRRRKMFAMLSPSASNSSGRAGRRECWAPVNRRTTNSGIRSIGRRCIAGYLRDSGCAGIGGLRSVPRRCSPIRTEPRPTAPWSWLPNSLCISSTDAISSVRHAI